MKFYISIIGVICLGFAFGWVLCEVLEKPLNLRNFPVGVIYLAMFSLGAWAAIFFSALAEALK